MIQTSELVNCEDMACHLACPVRASTRISAAHHLTFLAYSVEGISESTGSQYNDFKTYTLTLFQKILQLLEVHPRCS